MKESFNPFGNVPDSGFEFDMSISTLMRVNYYLYICNQLSGSENVQGMKDWFDAVRVVDREIDPLLKPGEREKLRELRVKVEQTLNLNAVSIGRRILYNQVDAYEREVRRFVNEKKLYMKRAEDAGKALLR